MGVAERSQTEARGPGTHLHSLPALTLTIDVCKSVLMVQVPFELTTYFVRGSCSEGEERGVVIRHWSFGANARQIILKFVLD